MGYWPSIIFMFINLIDKRLHFYFHFVAVKLTNNIFYLGYPSRKTITQFSIRSISRFGFNSIANYVEFFRIANYIIFFNSNFENLHFTRN